MIKEYLQVLLTLCLYTTPVALVVYILDKMFNSEK